MPCFASLKSKRTKAQKQKHITSELKSENKKLIELINKIIRKHPILFIYFYLEKRKLYIYKANKKMMLCFRCDAIKSNDKFPEQDLELCNTCFDGIYSNTSKKRMSKIKPMTQKEINKMMQCKGCGDSCLSTYSINDFCAACNGAHEQKY